MTYGKQILNSYIMEPIIRHFTDDDLYKFTMMYAVLQKFPFAKVEYEFICRDDSTIFPENFDIELMKQIKYMEDLRFTREEREFMENKLTFLPPSFFDFLSGYKFDSSEVSVFLDNGKLKLRVKGYWYRTIAWEVHLLSLISELYYKMTGLKTEKNEIWIERAQKKASLFRMNNCLFSDFGTRRRYSFDVQDEIVKNLIEYSKPSTFGSVFNGTSNVYLAMKYNVRPIGTMAHEWIMFHAVRYGYHYANYMAMENWADVYGGSLGIALTDTYTTDEFFKTFSLKQAKLFDGVRHDSGDPMVFAEKAIAFYEKMGIDPKSKTIIFSDGLNPETVVDIQTKIAGRIKIAFGIGTNLTNDVGVKPLNIVIKMTKANPDGNGTFVPTVKLSDVEGKHTGDKKHIQLALDTFNV